MKTVEFILPSYYASVFINSDESGLSDFEQVCINNFVEHNLKIYPVFHCIDADVENTYFSHFNDLDGMKNLAGDVCKYTFCVSP